MFISILFKYVFWSLQYFYLFSVYETRDFGKHNMRKNKRKLAYIFNFTSVQRVRYVPFLQDQSTLFFYFLYVCITHIWKFGESSIRRLFNSLIVMAN